MKKYSSIILSLALALLCALCLAGCLGDGAAEGSLPREGRTADGYDYYLTSEDTVSLLKYHGSLAEVVVPSDIEGYPVRELSSTFKGNKTITSVTVPVGVESIRLAFSGCTNLVSVELPSGITDINSAFVDCSSLTSVNLPKGLNAISPSAFKGCSSLTDIILPSSIQEISDSAFSGCSALTEVRIPDGVKSIGVHAFQGCAALKKIDIPAAVKEIGFMAFKGCSALGSITFATGLERIEAGAFENCTSLEAVELPIGLESLGASAFGGCTKLADIIYPSSVDIGWDAFFKTPYALKEGLFITDSGTVLSINLPEDATELIIPEGVKSIAASLPDDNSIENIVLPASLKDGGEFANRAYKLKSITVAEGNERYCDIEGVLYDKTYNGIVVYPKEKTDDTFTVPQGTKVANFSNRHLKHIILPESFLTNLDAYFNQIMKEIDMVGEIPDDGTSLAETLWRLFLDENNFEKITFDYARPENAEAIEKWFEQYDDEIVIEWK